VDSSGDDLPQAATAASRESQAIEKQNDAESFESRRLRNALIGMDSSDDDSPQAAAGGHVKGKKSNSKEPVHKRGSKSKYNSGKDRIRRGPVSKSKGPVYDNYELLRKNERMAEKAEAQYNASVAANVVETKGSKSKHNSSKDQIRRGLVSKSKGPVYDNYELLRKNERMAEKAEAQYNASVAAKVVETVQPSRVGIAQADTLQGATCSAGLTVLGVDIDQAADGSPSSNGRQKRLLSPGRLREFRAIEKRNDAEGFEARRHRNALVHCSDADTDSSDAPAPFFRHGGTELAGENTRTQ
jgi:hypothetical protein